MASGITCVIEYDIEPWAQEQFKAYADLWAQAIPDCGADLFGYLAPREGSLSKGYGIYTLPSLAAYEAYKARLRAHPSAEKAYGLAKKERFIRYEDRTFLTRIGPKDGPA